MSRNVLGALALLLLLGLTAATFLLAEGQTSNYVIGGLALAKAAVICGVFLEMGRSWPGWAAIALLLLLAVVFGAAGLIAL